MSSARLLLTGAAGYVEAAVCLQKLHEGGGLHHWPSQAVNVGLAFELALKAYCAHHGSSDRDLRGLGHDLMATLDVAVAFGFEPAPQVRDVIAVLGPNYLDHSLRYLQGRQVELPVPAVMLPAVHATVQGVANQIGVENL